MVPSFELFIRCFDALDDGYIIFDLDGNICYHNFKSAAIFERAGIILKDSNLDSLVCAFGISGFTESYKELRTDYQRDSRTFHIVLKRIVLESGEIVLMHIGESPARDRQVNRIYRYNSEILTRIKCRVTAVQNALSFFVEFDKERLADDQYSLMQECRCEIWRLMRYAENVGDLSLIQAGELRFRLDLERVDMRDVVEAAVSELRFYVEALRRPFRIFIHGYESVLSVACDRRRLQRVIESLLLNSVFYAGLDAEIRLEVCLDGHDALIRVDDNGPGLLVAADRSKLFHYPFRGRDAARIEAGGLGIELFLARHLMAAQKGSIRYLELEDSESVGAHFEVRVPLVG